MTLQTVTITPGKPVAELEAWAKSLALRAEALNAALADHARRQPRGLFATTHKRAQWERRRDGLMEAGAALIAEQQALLAHTQTVVLADPAVQAAAVESTCAGCGAPLRLPFALVDAVHTCPACGAGLDLHPTVTLVGETAPPLVLVGPEETTAW